MERALSIVLGLGVVGLGAVMALKGMSIPAPVASAASADAAADAKRDDASSTAMGAPETPDAGVQLLADLAIEEPAARAGAAQLPQGAPRVVRFGVILVQFE